MSWEELPKAADYQAFLGAMFSDDYLKYFEKEPVKFWSAIGRVLDGQRMLLFRYYVLVVLLGMLVGALTKYYGWLRTIPVIRSIYAPIAERLLLRSVSQWHMQLTAFNFPEPADVRVLVDVLTRDDHLYRGVVREHYLSQQGDLQGLLIDEALRFDRVGYLALKADGKSPKAPEYWRPIPGKKLYFFADNIANLNMEYETKPKMLLSNELKAIIEENRLDISEGDLELELEFDPDLEDTEEFSPPR